MKMTCNWVTARSASVVVFLALGIATIPCVAHDAGTPATNQQSEAAVRQASALEVTAFLQKDASQLAGLWSDDMVVTNPLNKFVDKRRVLGMVQSGVLTFTAYDRAIDYAHVYGDTVILAGHERVTWGSKMPHAGETDNLLFTAIWMKMGGRWQEVARHANVLPPTHT